MHAKFIRLALAALAFGFIGFPSAQAADDATTRSMAQQSPGSAPHLLPY